ncbi:restriction endonuclease subunit S [Vibrio sp. Vb2976]|uniref:restriction endonuclease subunit S n=1 Tax=Vibrio sp. Vb2976 TaxID=3074694 RepID=UPI0029653EA3|nr:restriction endonuclease subunit S [Vibrio sp. Vb2976]MDW1645249.1 restriction endonuclease subunit S [Vibrio sp. Vb2976]
MSFNELFGSIPDGWRSCTLGELVKEFNGSIQTGPFGSQLHAADYVEDGIPSIMPKNIRIDGVDDSDIARVSPEDIERLSKYKVQTGDIVYSRRGDVEKCSLITEKENGWLCGTGCLRVRLQTEEVSPEFLHAYLCHPAVREWIVRHAVGATMPNLNTSILSALPVLVPTSDSMAAITSNWNAISSKLVINSKINQTLEEMAQVIFKSWFVDFDPVKAKMNGEQPEGMDAATASLFPEKLVESELGLIPEGWEIESLAELMDIKGGTQPPSKHFADELREGYVRLVQIRDYDTDNHLTYIPDEKKLRRTSPLDVMIGRYGAAVGRILWGLSGAYNVALVKAEPKRENVREFLRTYLLSNKFQAPMQMMSGRSAQSGFNKSDIASYKLALPSPELFEEYENLALPIRRYGLSLKQQTRDLEVLRDTLLPKLLSGEIELVEQS